MCLIIIYTHIESEVYSEISLLNFQKYLYAFGVICDLEKNEVKV